MANIRHAIAAALLIPSSAVAQDGWQYSVSVYGWFSGLGSTVSTPFGDVETDLSFSDVWDNLDMAAFGAFEARNGRWSLIGDLVYADLGAEEPTPLGALFRQAEIDVTTTLVSAYAAYAVLDTPQTRLDLAGGVRYNSMDIEFGLISNGGPADFNFASSDSWWDPLVGARVHHAFNDQWSGIASADVGGFSMGDGADLTWQAYVGIGYRFNERWSAQAGYRHLSIERNFNGRDVEIEISGPLVGVQYTF